MKYHDLKLRRQKYPNRVGRGISAGQGKTAGRGTKGQKSRTGSGAKPGFEGGQNPLMARLPKLRGFTSHHDKTEVVYTGDLNHVKGPVADNFSLYEAGILANPHANCKLILKGSITKKLEVRLQNASAGAISALEKAGGKFIRVDRQARKSKIDKKERAKTA